MYAHKARRTAHAPPPETSLVRKAPPQRYVALSNHGGLSTHLYKVSADDGGSATPPPPPAQTSIVGADVKVIFDKYDRDRSADIDVTELHQALHALGLKANTVEASQILERFDASRTGRLNLFEFDCLVKQLRAHQATLGHGAPRHECTPASNATTAASPTNIPERVRAVFERYDKDRSSDIDTQELRAALNALGLNTTDDEADALLSKSDVDRSGRLDLREFTLLVTQLERFREDASPPHTHNVQRAAPHGPAPAPAVRVDHSCGDALTRPQQPRTFSTSVTQRAYE